MIDAYLGRKEDALREGQHAVDLAHAQKDVMEEIGRLTNLAMIAAWVGDKDLAFEELDSIIRLPKPSQLRWAETIPVVGPSAQRPTL